MLVSSEPGPEAASSRLPLVLTQTPFPVEILDPDALVLWGNPAYLRVFGGPVDSSFPSPSRAFPEVWPDGRSRRELLQGVRLTGLWRGEAPVETRSGTTWHRVCVFPLTAATESSREFAVFYEDIQREVEGREDLLRQQNLVAIRSRQSQMGDLLSMIAHQWRQPLTVVMSLIGNIQLKARMGGLDPEYLAVKLERISQTVHFLSETIDSFRNFYAPTKYKSDEDLSFLARRALELLTPSLEKNGVTVEFVAAERPVRIRGFTGELMQVALELITKARDALPGEAATPTLRLSVETEGDWAVLRVENNGGGLPSEVLPHLYDPIYTTKAGSSETAMGLYLAKDLVENHHSGTLTATTHEGWTSFVCRLPREGDE